MNTNSNPESEDDDLFYFESDHLALKGNKDYSEVLKTIFILEAQRSTAIQDYDKVVNLQKEALNDPLEFVQKLKNGDDVGIPKLQVIAEVPNINWAKFDVPLPEEGLKFVNSKSSHVSKKINLKEEEDKIRRKADTHSKHWTTEEQKRLEELLVIHPPEAIELQRYRKIAAALGNRTVKQVTSRIQKYFLKLYDAGLPIPGRIPKCAGRTKKKSKLHSHQRLNHYLFKKTTFFPELDIPVVMNESEQIPGPSTNRSITDANMLNYLIPSSTEQTEQKSSDQPKSELEMQLDILRRVKRDKEFGNSVSIRHVGFKCDYCDEEPLIGTRWHCRDCSSESVDFCSDCVVAQMYSSNAHPISHTLQPIKQDGSNQNVIYSEDSFGESSSESTLESSNKNVESSNEMSETEEDDDPKELEDMEDETESTDSLLHLKQQSREDIGYEQVSTNDYILDDEDVIGGMEDEAVESQDFNTNEYSSGLTDTQNVSYSYLHSNLLLDS